MLTKLSETLGLPVHLAIIPRDADGELAQYVARHTALVPVVHGWAHLDHAPKDEKKSEFRLHRPMGEIIGDAHLGLQHLRGVFGDRVSPMFVPPWNRIAPEVVQQLPGLGYRFLSTATPRKTAKPAPELEQINTHLDPIDWRGTRGLADPDMLIVKTAQMLRDRREGQTDNTEPFGVLTHHLVHDQDIWTFTEILLQKLMAGPSYVWTAPSINQTGDPE